MGVLNPGAYCLTRRPRPWFAAVLIAVAVSVAWPGLAATQNASGADIKAAFLLNFAKFIEWPPLPGGEFGIGVIGDDAVAEALRDLAKGKSVGGRPLTTRRVVIKDNLAELQVLFIGASEGARLSDVLQRTSAGSVLTVSDLDRFSLQGGTIEFRSERERVRFDINLDQAERSRLVINSKLLALARTVYHRDKTPGGAR